MTIVLIAVYVPIGFQGGSQGRFSPEFAFTVAGAVAVSGIVALTLSPMMTSRIFRAEQESGRFVRFVDRQFERLHHGYQRALHALLETWIVIVVMGLLLLGGTVYLFMTSKAELAPQEDQGIVLMQVLGAPNATPQQMAVYAKQVFDISKSLPEYDQLFQITGVPTVNQGIGGVLFKPWNERKRSALDLQQELQQKFGTIAGATVAAFQFPPLPGSRGLPMQIVLKTTESNERLNDVVQAVLQKARSSGLFFYVDTDLKLDKPQTVVEVDRDLISTLGLTQQDVGAAGRGLGGGYVSCSRSPGARTR
jgi:multidrug efflux pump